MAVAANGRRGRPQGKCHREETAGAGQLVQARVKRCGKSAPRLRQRRRHGKPHREQDRIGAARVREATLAPARSSPPPGLVARGTERSAPQRNGRRGETLSKQNPAYRPAGNCRLGPAFPEADAQRRLSGILPRSRQNAHDVKSSTALAGKTPALRAGALRPGTHHFETWRSARYSRGLFRGPMPVTNDCIGGHLTWRLR